MPASSANSSPRGHHAQSHPGCSVHVQSPKALCGRKLDLESWASEGAQRGAQAHHHHPQAAADSHRLPRSPSLQPCPSFCREPEGWEIPEGPVTEHKPIFRTLHLTEAQRRRMHEPEGAKQRRKEERAWAHDWAETAAAAEEAGLYEPGVEVSCGGRPQQEHGQHGPQRPAPELNSMEVRGGCCAPLSSQTASPATRPAWLQVSKLRSAAPCCLPACHRQQTWALFSFFRPACLHDNRWSILSQNCALPAGVPTACPGTSAAACRPSPSR